MHPSNLKVWFTHKAEECVLQLDHYFICTPPNICMLTFFYICISIMVRQIMPV